METVNKFHSLYFVITNALLFCLQPSYLEKINCFVFSPYIRIGFLYHNSFRALIPSCISQPHVRARILEIL